MSEYKLYKEYEPELKHPDVFAKSYDDEFIHIRLRPFYIPEDLELYRKWVKKDVGASPFVTSLRSVIAQSLTGLINHKQVLEVDFLRAPNYYSSDAIEGITLTEKDAMMQAVMDPAVIDERLAGYILSACLEYAFYCPEAERVFWVPDTGHDYYDKLIQATGPGWETITGADNQVLGYKLR